MTAFVTTPHFTKNFEESAFVQVAVDLTRCSCVEFRRADPASVSKAFFLLFLSWNQVKKLSGAGAERLVTGLAQDLGRSCFPARVCVEAGFSSQIYNDLFSGAETRKIERSHVEAQP